MQTTNNNIKSAHKQSKTQQHLKIIKIQINSKKTASKKT